MFPNCVSKMFHKCQKAVRAQNSCNFGLNQASHDGVLQTDWKTLFRVSTWRPNIFRVTVNENYSTVTEHKLRLLRELMLQHWRQSRLLRLLHQQLPAVLKLRPTNTIRLWAQQFEFVIAQRIRRSQQIFSLYSKLWEERALRDVVSRLSDRGRLFLLASSMAAMFDWERGRISDDTLSRHLDDIELAYQLQETTVTCMQCGLRIKFDQTLPGIQYCTCHGNSRNHAPAGGDFDWQPYFEREDVTIWRQRQKDHAGLFSYKVYGRYDDVSAQDFLKVQLDTKYRPEWDTTAVNLQVLDAEASSGSEILYWETRWPSFLSNRDYVFTRRTIVNPDRTRYVIGCESTEHPGSPPRSGVHRVTHYWSFMVIKPTISFDQPGIEFCLTYFDDPGSAISTAVVTWVGIRGMPEFLQQLRRAAKQVRVTQGERPEPSVAVIGNPAIQRGDPDLDDLFH